MEKQKKSHRRTKQSVSGTACTAPPSATTPVDHSLASVRETAQVELRRATLPLQRALETIINSLAKKPGSGMDLARAFKIEQTLAWRVWRLVQAKTGEEVASFVMGPSALRTFLAAAGRQGVPSSVLQMARKAHCEYREFVDRFAGDDATLRLMLGPLQTDHAGVSLGENQMLFDANRVRIGCHASSHVYSCILFRAPGQTNVSLAMIDVATDLWWLRPDGRAVFWSYQIVRKPGESGSLSPYKIAPMDPALIQLEQQTDQPTEIPLIQEFCFGNTTALESSDVGQVRMLTAYPRALGRNAASTICLGRYLREIFPPISVDPDTEIARSIYLPSELLVFDLYVAADLVDEGFRFTPYVTDSMFIPVRYVDMAAAIDLATLGGTFEVIEPTNLFDNPTKMTRYRELMEWAFQQVGGLRENFYCFRVRVPLPPLGVTFYLNTGG